MLRLHRLRRPGGGHLIGRGLGRCFRRRLRLGRPGLRDDDGADGADRRCLYGDRLGNDRFCRDGLRRGLSLRRLLGLRSRLGLRGRLRLRTGSGLR
ncbi:hypothetical protein G3I58_34710, partial [Streptomyces anulatus]|nr:hypothetical protein [Streptomyces anulatus]